jgi:hypothetical protein
VQAFADEPQQRPIGDPGLEHLLESGAIQTVERPLDRLPTTTSPAIPIK